ncbi:MAG TPA: TIGR03084 family metal-binding protein [Acidimicrobiales bacterium]|nr:TIGR03084 family metal-binding protein [Acidimicrobiales bacterium]|tara:strand:- start:200 stop:997 length:798 start_codon:yes stop_codon:yes gene_type:complete
MDIAGIASDLRDEQLALDEVVAELDDNSWNLDTPSPRWSVADQIAHLTYFDYTAAIAISDPDLFKELVNDLISNATGNSDSVDEFTLGKYRKLSPVELLKEWRSERQHLAEASESLENDTRVAWYGPSMGARSFLTARLMEVWAHGQNIVDAVDAYRAPTERLRHIAQLGFITRKWTYINRGLEVPSDDVIVNLTSPSGDLWSWGPENGDSSIEGSAEDFCLVVTQRRHLDDTSLVLQGDSARDWLTKAQVFAGPATDGPNPGGR